MIDNVTLFIRGMPAMEASMKTAVLVYLVMKGFVCLPLRLEVIQTFPAMTCGGMNAFRKTTILIHRHLTRFCCGCA